MKFKIDLTDISKLMPKVKDDLADKLTKYVKSKIRAGMAPALKKPRKDGSTHTPLFHTGIHLHNSIKSAVDRDKIQIGSDFIGAATLHNGGRGVPARKYLEPDSNMITIIETTFKKYSRK